MSCFLFSTIHFGCSSVRILRRNLGFRGSPTNFFSLRSFSNDSNQQSFTVNYLINELGFFPKTALKVSKLVNFKTPEKPEKVINLLISKLELIRTARLITMPLLNCPFEVGQLVESRSFLEGFRGAWFCSKIKNVSLRKCQIGCVLEFLDFPDERKTWTKLYQKSPTSNRKQKDMQIMVRPCFPPVYHETQMPEVDAISDVVVIVNDTWKVGDLVDWWKDGCYWSGRIVQMFEDGKCQMDLFPPPQGEGLSYEVYCKDLRPSLDWSLEVGWTVPIPVDLDNGQRCARIIKPINKAKGSNPSSKECSTDERDTVPGISGASRSSVPSHFPSSKAHSTGEERNVVQGISGASRSSVPSHVPSSKACSNGEERNMVQGISGASRSSVPSLKARSTSEERNIVQGISGASRSSVPSHVPSPKARSASEERDAVQSVSGASLSSVPVHVPSSEMHTPGEEREAILVISGASQSSVPSHIPSSKARTTSEERERVWGISGASQSSVPSHVPSSKVHTMGEERERVQAISGASQSSVPSHVSSSSSKPSDKLECMEKQTLNDIAAEEDMHTLEKGTELDMGNGRSEKTSSSDSDSSSHDKAESTGTHVELDLANGGSGKTSCSDSDSSSHDKAESIGTGDENSVGKDRIGDGEEIKANQGMTGTSKLPFTSHVSSRSSDAPEKLEEIKKSKSPFTSRVSSSSSEPLAKLEEIKKRPLDSMAENGMRTQGTTSCSDSDSSSNVKAGLTTEMFETPLENDRLDDGGSAKKMRTDDGNIILESMFSDTIEAAILDLEELVNQVKWMKNTLEVGITSSIMTRPPWKFLGHLGSSTPK